MFPMIKLLYKIKVGENMILTVDNIVKSFGDKSVLKGISFNAESGKALGILGRNGAGKTTLIRIIMGVFGADSGNILIDGYPIDRKNLKMGYLPEERGLYPKKKIMEQLYYFASLKGVTKKVAKERADMLFKKLQIEEYKNVRLETLSKGNQQKVQLVAALICNPDMVILDEPFSGLDPVNATLLKELVTELIDNGKIVLFSSHQMNYIEEFCNNIVILNGGEIVLGGNIDEIKKSYPRNIIEIKTDNIEKLSDYLKNSTFNNFKVEKNTLTITLEREDLKQDLLKFISESHIDIDEIKVKEPTLNEIFVKYTEGQI